MQATEQQINYFIELMRRSRLAKEFFHNVQDGADTSLLQCREFAKRIQYDELTDLLDSLVTYDRTSSKYEMEYIKGKLKLILARLNA